MGAKGLVALVATVVLAAWTPSAGAQSTPENGRIYYDVGGQLVSVLPDGSERRSIGEGSAVSVHPDGELIAFQREGGFGGVWIAGADGSHPFQLSPPEEFASDPTWSPDGTRLAMVRDTPYRDVWIFDFSDSGSQAWTNVTPEPFTFEADPAWSPDGESLAFVSDRSGAFQIYRAPAREPGPDDPPPVRLTQSSTWEQFPDWSPDGKRIAHNHDLGRDIRVVSADGSGEEPFVEGGANPSWSPDGERLAFVRQDGVWVRQADGETTLVSPESDQVGLPDWSEVQELPDGDGDTWSDGNDNCVAVANEDQADTDGDGLGDACEGVDDDNDGVANDTDNCREVVNPGQDDLDRDGLGDACDPDVDGDAVANDNDNCPAAANGEQRDTDADGLGDACDPTPLPSTGQQASSTHSGGTQQQQQPPPAQQQQQPPPPPELRETVTVAPKRGRVVVTPPGGTPRELRDGETIPVGSIVDTRRGAVTLTAAKPGGGTASADFSDGVFRVTQDRSGITDLRLTETLRCPTTRRSGRARSAAGVKSRRLWGRGKGRFRTTGKHSAATVRGTWWLVEDTCTTTTTRVRDGSVTVRDFIRDKTAVVRSGRHYVARARR